MVVEGLTVTYGAASAVRDVSFTAPAGVVTAVVGPNGAGKSSLLLGVYGSVHARGSVRVGDRDMSRLSAMSRARQGIAIVPQGRQLFPKMSVRENLQVAAEVQRLGRDRVEAALDRFPILRERSGHMAGVLSGGEQQMLAVSRALMGDPSVLLLDEMATGLAPKIVADLVRVVRELADQGVAVVLADPSLNATGAAVERGYVLVRGEVVAQEDGVERLDRAYQGAMGLIQKELDEVDGEVTG
ncbi:ATP-binding cassette domain-containing protein [Nocardioides anomalus]|uniref:ATP-binding cassette domain-containing protein n=1 Tax=Nocardioides anomalus TaxID=2712223 RepID=A0A6G6WM44_9ACTN|nr:ATP-binding cassette domain-containing protein [Nocardioides anomalus]